VIIAIDDVVRAVGLEQIDRYVKWLYELLWRVREECSLRAVSFVVTTSEGV